MVLFNQETFVKAIVQVNATFSDNAFVLYIIVFIYMVNGKWTVLV